jgi:hypothetical protein
MLYEAREHCSLIVFFVRIGAVSLVTAATREKISWKGWKDIVEGVGNSRKESGTATWQCYKDRGKLLRSAKGYWIAYGEFLKGIEKPLRNAKIMTGTHWANAPSGWVCELFTTTMMDLRN